MKAAWITVLLIGSLMLAGCDKAPMNAQNEIPKGKLLEVAKNYIEEQEPDWKQSLALPALVADRGKYWEVSYQLPPTNIGGTPVVEIDKTSLKVLKAYHTQ